MADDNLPKGPGGPVVLDTPVYDELARRADRGNNLTITGPSVRVIETQTGRVVYIASTPGNSVQRMKSKTAADANGVAVCNTWDGTTAGTSDINVLVTGHRAVGEILFAMPTAPSTGKTIAGADVIYLEYATNYTYPVKLTVESGGSAGSKTTGCTYTYTVKDAATNTITLGTGMTPTMLRRTAKGGFVAATAGIACFVGGTFTLWDCDERPAVGLRNC